MARPIRVDTWKVQILATPFATLQLVDVYNAQSQRPKAVHIREQLVVVPDEATCKLPCMQASHQVHSRSSCRGPSSLAAK